MKPKRAMNGMSFYIILLAVIIFVSFFMSRMTQPDQVALSDLTRSEAAKEVAILSTCNRTEIYCAAETPEAVIDWLSRYHQIERSEIAPYLYTHDQPEAIRHAFRVASGLDSMVIGEPQILGQMKDAVPPVRIFWTSVPQTGQGLPSRYPTRKSLKPPERP